MARRVSANERTPLLLEVPPEPIENGAIERQDEAVEPQDVTPEQPQDDDTIAAKEPTAKELAVILSSSYLGVFLGALGTFRIAVQE